jgi:hypothetical protein
MDSLNINAVSIAKSPVVVTPVVKPTVKERVHAEHEELRRSIDVAQFRIMPGAGAPQVSAQVDATLGSTGLLPWFLAKIERAASFGPKLANGIRFGTRLFGPAVFSFSAIWNARLLPKALKDPTLAPASKATLVLGEVGTILGAVTATVAAVPQRIAAFFGMAGTRQVLANKASGIAGGVAGIGFSAINLVETMHNKQSRPAERFFAKLGFAVGLVGFIAGTTALALSMGAMPGLMSLLPIASKVATVAGIGGLISGVGQLFFGKNKKLNTALKGSILG